MIRFLIDRNLEGPVSILWGMFAYEGWQTFFPLELKAMVEVGLPEYSDDQTVWRFAQLHQMILFTGNRCLAPGDLLEQTIRHENTPTSLPVLSITQTDLITQDRYYQEMCLDKLLEILENLDNYRGRGRIFLP